MRYIAHRGNLNGPSPDENKPEYILAALDAGYEAEVDAWMMEDGFYLGHDKPSYKVDRFLFQNQRIWTHCKNVAALFELSKYLDVNCFFQDNDEIALTSRGYLWAHSRCATYDEKTVVVSLGPIWAGTGRKPLGICTDYASAFKEVAKEDRLPFDVLVCDIDGVLTSGKSYDLSGAVAGKTYCDLDFTAIKRFKAAGIEVCFLSGDLKVNQAMALSRRIEFFHNPPGMDKVDVLPDIVKRYNTSRIAYVGDDYYDIQIMSTVSHSFCPITSPAPVRRAAKHIIPVEAGKGVLAGLYDMMENHIPYAFPRDSADVNPK